jgi:hypothetical protein
MKNAVIIFGFIICAIAGFALMSMSGNMHFDAGPWAQGGKHLLEVEKVAQPMMDKCKLDRLQGRLKNHEESVGCSNPTIREAFIKEGFTNLQKLDEYLNLRKEYAKKLDANEVTEDQKRSLTEEALVNMLDFAPAEPQKK